MDNRAEREHGSCTLKRGGEGGEQRCVVSWTRCTDTVRAKSDRDPTSDGNLDCDPEVSRRQAEEDFQKPRV